MKNEEFMCMFYGVADGTMLLVCFMFCLLDTNYIVCHILTDKLGPASSSSLSLSSSARNRPLLSID